MSISSEIDTIPQNYRFAERFNLLAKVILFGVSPYYLAKPKPFGETMGAKIVYYDQYSHFFGTN